MLPLLLNIETTNGVVNIYKSLFLLKLFFGILKKFVITNIKITKIIIFDLAGKKKLRIKIQFDKTNTPVNK